MKTEEKARMLNKIKKVNIWRFGIQKAWAGAGETTPGLDKSTGKSYLPLPPGGSRVGYPARGITPAIKQAAV